MFQKCKCLTLYNNCTRTDQHKTRTRSKPKAETMTTTTKAPNLELADVDAIVAGIGREERHTIAILQAIQEKYNYLPQEALRRVCEVTEITPAEITGVSTFYTQFRHRPAGKHVIKLCAGTACHVMGSDMIYDALKRELDITGTDDTDKSGIFTIEKVACLGCCMLAPAIQIDDITYGHLTTQKAPNVLADFLSSQEVAEVSAASGRKFGRLDGEIRLCLCSSCSASGARQVHDELRSQIERFHLPAKLKTVGCTGMAYQAPLVDVALRNGRTYQYGRVRPQDTQALVFTHFKPASLLGRGSAAVASLLDRMLTSEQDEPVTRYPVDVRFGPDSLYVGQQYQIATEHGGGLDPLDLDEYLGSGGFDTLKQCLLERSPELIIEEINQSGLRGRGGAGFPTGIKWGIVSKAESDLKYLICNGDEGDPGAFMDRMILESFPFRVIEGMLIAAYAVGCAEGYFYIRAEYPHALKRIHQALKICEQRGFLGDDVMGTGFRCRLHVVPAAGAFVCGEETALIASIEGKRGMPTLRPPYPAEKGLWGKPTLVNNVETFATVPWIMRNSASQFASLGTAKSKGTKTFALAGKIERSGLIEVPMGLTLRQIVEEIGGGVKDGRKLKAIQVGGPSGGCIPASLADTPVDYEALTQIGAIMGSGGMVVLDETDCMVDMARYFMSFTQKESCGKCTFCRVGTKRMLEILDRLCEGKGKRDDLDALEQLTSSVKAGSICGLGKTAPNPVVSLLNYFRQEYEAHVDGRCPAGRCKALITYTIDEKCIGCTLCAQKCAFDAIAMQPYQQHVIVQDNCTKCDICRQVCPVDAVLVS